MKFGMAEDNLIYLLYVQFHQFNLCQRWAMQFTYFNSFIYNAIQIKFGIFLIYIITQVWANQLVAKSSYALD